jgi:hypothetical protein
MPAGIAGTATDANPPGPFRQSDEAVAYQNTSSYPSPFASRTRAV